MPRLCLPLTLGGPYQARAIISYPPVFLSCLLEAFTSKLPLALPTLLTSMVEKSGESILVKKGQPFHRLLWGSPNGHLILMESPKVHTRCLLRAPSSARKGLVPLLFPQH